MSTVTTSEGWMTSFIYEQDLTSAYMNSTLYSLFRPGVYNADIYVKPGSYNSSSDATNDGLTLIIKKGTTLVFSNDYFDDKSEFSGDGSHQVFRRSFTCENKNAGELTSTGSLIGNRFPIVIKCVAMSDIVVSGVAQAASENVNDKSCQPWGDDTEDDTSPESLYLCASIRYDQVDGGDFPSTPTFRLFRNNPYYGDFTDEEYKDKGRFFYIGTHVDDIPNSTSDDKVYWRLPDGCNSYDGHGSSVMMQYSYLMLGVLSDKNPPEKYESFSEDWFKNHTFSARCLPEYRNNMIGASNERYPDFIIPLVSEDTNKFSRLYIDFKDVMNFGNIYNTSINWESAYDIADTSTAPFPKFDKLAGIEGKDYISYSLTETEVQKIKASEKEFLVLDFTYALSKNVLNSEANLDRGEDILSIGDILSNNNSINLFNHRELIELESGNDNETPSSKIKEKLKFRTNLMRLDISKSNVNRLLEFIENKNLLFRIISKMRSSGEIDPSTGESIVPIALAFRILKKKDNSIVSAVYDNITSADSVNPINVLSLLDLSYKMTKLNSLSNLSQDAFTILPVIE